MLRLWRVGLVALGQADLGHELADEAPLGDCAHLPDAVRLGIRPRCEARGRIPRFLPHELAKHPRHVLHVVRCGIGGELGRPTGVLVEQRHQACLQPSAMHTTTGSACVHYGLQERHRPQEALLGHLVPRLHQRTQELVHRAARMLVHHIVQHTK
eukprot:15440590-Alexandrium_andersonii.AAC.1